MSRYLTAGLLLLLAAMAFAGCRKNSADDTISQKTVPAEIASPALPIELGTVCQNGQLMAAAETREEAQTLADLYGIELVDWAHGMALFRTTEDPCVVIQRGQDNGWPELVWNNVSHMDK